MTDRQDTAGRGDDRKADDRKDRATLSPDIAARLAELRQGFIARLPGQLAEIEALTAQPGASDAIARIAHGIVGGGGTFGMPELSQAARAVEMVAKSGAGNADGRLVESVSLLRRAVGAALARPDAAAPPVLPDLELGRSGRVYLLEDDEAQAADLIEQLRPYGFEVTSFATVPAFVEAARQNPPDALLVDVVCEGDLLAGPGALAAIAAGGSRPPAIFLSGRQDFEARLEAVRAGGNGYIAKPCDVAVLVDLLDLLLGRAEPDPYRVLMVEDDPIQGQIAVTALGAGGMTVRLVVDPATALEEIRDFNPDLVITDVQMPGCSGFELAAVLRQAEGMLALPILFLTADAEAAGRRQAMDLGADAYLMKPIALKELVRQVRSRASRARQLRSLMARDSLTGVLNHAMVQERLAAEVSRALREGSPLSFAMIDLDFFKQVNDTHGHMVGDRVLKALSRLLQQRLRRSDVIGRYGGEEFAVLMPGTNGADAAQRLDLIRREFAQIAFAGGQTFHVTYSAGVAELQPHGDARLLSLEADAELYRAKRAGRDRVLFGGA